jgi:hypothetical protein
MNRDPKIWTMNPQRVSGFGLAFVIAAAVALALIAWAAMEALS